MVLFKETVPFFFALSYLTILKYTNASIKKTSVYTYCPVEHSLLLCLILLLNHLLFPALPFLRHLVLVFR